MIKSYLKTAIRNIRMHKGYSIINITGLAIGIAACLLILLFVQRELSFEKMFARGERIYRKTPTWNLMH